MDILYIDQLTVMASIGIYGWEKQCLQKLIFDLKIACVDKYFVSNSTVYSYLDYTQINQVILNLMVNRHFLLIENVAEEVSKVLMKQFLMIYWIYVKVSKPSALCNAWNVGICIERTRI